MSEESKQRATKLLEAWEAPAGGGEPIGCIATSFTFSASFFEEECLSRFLHLETDSKEHTGAYLIEREEKLSQCKCVAALVDQHHVRSARNLRWDLISARPKTAILHAKVSLLLWNEWARVIIASANLTPDGYRRNREVMGVVDYFKGCSAPSPFLKSVLEYLQYALTTVGLGATPSSPSVDRCVSLLKEAERATRWANQKEGRFTSPRFIGTGPGRPNVFERLSAEWENGLRPRQAWVASPFFDFGKGDYEPANKLWSVLNQHGEASIIYDLQAEDMPDGKKLLLRGPESLKNTFPRNRTECDVNFYRLKDDPERPFHAKCLYLHSADCDGYMLGSSNFTSAGTGLARNSNLEANIFYVSREGSDLSEAYPLSDEIHDGTEIHFAPAKNNDDAENPDICVLPLAFGNAVYGREVDCGYLDLSFTGTPPSDWTVSIENKVEALFDAARWQAAGEPLTVRLQWEDLSPPTILLVKWSESTGNAYWPVQVRTGNDLPPPDLLRDLPLEELLRVLTSAKPAHVVLEEIVRRRQAKENRQTESMELLDPHKRVDTSAFLLQRTRRISKALGFLRERLERPTVSVEALHWRLYGPLGVKALADAIAREAQSKAEKCFLLTELSLELSRVKPANKEGFLPPKVVKEEVRILAKKMCTEALASLADCPQQMRDYLESVSVEASA